MALACLGLSVLVFGVVPILLKYFTGHIDGWTANGVRYGVSALLWLPFVLRNRQNVPAARNPWRDALVPSAINIAGQCTWGWSPYFNDASVLGFITRSSFLFAIVFGFWVLRAERPLAHRPGFWLGVAGTGAGVILMYAGGVGRGSTTPAGLLLLLLTSAAWGGYAVTVGKYMQGYSVRLAFGIVSIYTTAGLLPLMFLFGDTRQLGGLDSMQWIMLVVSGWLGVALGHILIFRVIQGLGPIVLNAGQSVTPFATALLALAFLGERLSMTQWIGGSVLIGSCMLVLQAKVRTGDARLDDA
jgi:drug/metabolite transporter (DMT)-like permease